jgi:hypothetical protein
MACLAAVVWTIKVAYLGVSGDGSETRVVTVVTPGTGAEGASKRIDAYLGCDKLAGCSLSEVM